MNAALRTDGITTTQRALSSKSRGILSGTFRTSAITALEFAIRSSSFFASSWPRANVIGANARIPIITTANRFRRIITKPSPSRYFLAVHLNPRYVFFSEFRPLVLRYGIEQYIRQRRNYLLSRNRSIRFDI